MATIIDVARMAGVSQGTASNVLNGKGNVSSEKIKAVEEAAKKLGYTINERAKMLRKGSGNIICVIVPSMEHGGIWKHEQRHGEYDTGTG